MKETTLAVRDDLARKIFVELIGRHLPTWVCDPKAENADVYLVYARHAFQAAGEFMLAAKEQHEKERNAGETK